MINRRLAIVNPLTPSKTSQLTPGSLSPDGKTQTAHSSPEHITSFVKAANWNSLPSPVTERTTIQAPCSICLRNAACSKLDVVHPSDYQLNSNTSRLPPYFCPSHAASGLLSGSTRNTGNNVQSVCPWSCAVTPTRDEHPLRAGLSLVQPFVATVAARQSHSCCQKCLSLQHINSGSRSFLPDQHSAVHFPVSPSSHQIPLPQLSPEINTTQGVSMASTPTSSFRLAKATSDSCDPPDSDMLSFRRGDVIVILGACDTCDMKQEAMYRGYLLSQGPQLAGLIPGSKIALENSSTVAGDSTKVKVDFAVQTEPETDANEEYSSETDCSDCSDAETPSVSLQTNSEDQSKSMKPNRSPSLFTSKPTVANDRTDVLDSPTTSPQHSMRSTNSISFIEQDQVVGPPLAPTNNLHVVFRGESTKRNSATSLDSGRDSTYAGSSEGSSGHPNAVHASLTTSVDKGPVSVKTSPSRKCFAYQQSCMTSSTQFSGDQFYGPGSLVLPENQQPRNNPNEPQYERSLFESADKVPIRFYPQSSSTQCSIPLPVSNYLQTSYPNYLSKCPEGLLKPPLSSSSAVTYSTYQFPVTLGSPPSCTASASVTKPLTHYSPSSGRVYSKPSDVHPVGMQFYSRVACERQELSRWLFSVGLSRLEENLMNSGFGLWTLCRATPEELNACGITNPYDRQILRTELNRLRLVDPISDQVPDRVQDWLAQLDLDVYWPCLYNHGYTSFDRLVKLTWEDLEEIGVTKLGHQKKILLAVAKIKRQMRAASYSPPSTSPVKPQADACPQNGVFPTSHKSPFGGLSSCSMDSTADGLETLCQRSVSSATSNAIQPPKNNPDFVDCLAESPPLPAPPLAFRDLLPGSLEHESVSPSNPSVHSKQTGLENEPLNLLPPAVPLRRSSVVKHVSESAADLAAPGLDSLRHSRAQRHGHLLMGRERTGSEPDLLNCFVRRSSSPVFMSQTAKPLASQLTKWSSGQLTEPQLRLPSDYQTSLDPELQDMQNLRAMLDALSEHLTTATQL
ncbi:Caskin-1 [Clonorchis sinensis]|uniref:Caskin-1 n=1 Tax=Clonorchis sinensis TaxID=79923 RepID=A0A8T1MFG4_CLOSI|nr:Caskin-1 [Clonorchis sinensis]